LLLEVPVALWSISFQNPACWSENINPEIGVSSGQFQVYEVVGKFGNSVGKYLKYKKEILGFLAFY
jgi:hypothetical protein